MALLTVEFNGMTMGRGDGCTVQFVNIKIVKSWHIPLAVNAAKMPKNK